MIKFLSSWIEQITVAVILVSIFEMILPNGNIKKYVKMILSIYVVFNIIYPFVDSKALYNFDINDITNLTENSISNLNVNSNSKSLNQENMDNRLESLYIEEIENNIKNKLDELGYNTKKCKVDAVLSKEKSNSRNK